jgi:hypothetical protein
VSIAGYRGAGQYLTDKVDAAGEVDVGGNTVVGVGCAQRQRQLLMTGDDDPWVGPRLVWGLLEVIDSSTAEPWTAVLAHHLGLDGAEPEHRAGRRARAPRRAPLRHGGAASPAVRLLQRQPPNDADGLGTKPRDRWRRGGTDG